MALMIASGLKHWVTYEGDSKSYVAYSTVCRDYRLAGQRLFLLHANLLRIRGYQKNATLCSPEAKLNMS